MEVLYYCQCQASNMGTWSEMEDLCNKTNPFWLLARKRRGKEDVDENYFVRLEDMDKLWIETS